MSTEPQLFRIDPSTHESEAMNEVEFATLGFQERRDIQEWVAANPSILGDDLLIVSKEFSHFDRTDERPDLLAVDKEGKLVVIELKRDDSGKDAHWQAIKYASYLHRAKKEDIIRMLADHDKVSDEDALDHLLQHLNADDLSALNNDQRIILASHRFAPEVTSAAVWLNEKSPGENLMTCVQLIPYQDAESSALYIQANTIIPVPGIENYVIGIGESPTGDVSLVRGASALAQTFARNKNDGVTRFLRGVAGLAKNRLPDKTRPDRESKWAGGDPTERYYHMWYLRPLWGNWEMTYLVNLNQENGDSSDTWRADLGFAYWKVANEDLERKLEGLHICDDQRTANRQILVTRRGALDDSFADTLADTIKHFIEVVTPVVDEFEN